MADFDRAIVIDPTHATAWLNRGEAYRRLGDSKRAEEDTAKARQLEPGIVAATSPSPPPKQLVATAESKVSRPDSAARRERALQVAKDFLKSKGFHVESPPAPASFDLLCSKDSQHFRVEIQVPAEGQTALRFTREQIEAASRTDHRRRYWSSENSLRRLHPICRTRAVPWWNLSRTGNRCSKSSFRSFSSTRCTKGAPSHLVFRCSRMGTGASMIQASAAFPSIDYASHPAFRDFQPAQAQRTSAIRGNPRFPVPFAGVQNRANPGPTHERPLNY